MSLPRRSMRWNRQSPLDGNLCGLRIEQKQDALSAAEKHMAARELGDQLQFQNISIKLLGLIEVIDVKRSFKYRMRAHGGLHNREFLQVYQFVNPGAGKRHERKKRAFRKWRALGGSLNLHDAALAGHDKV